MFPNVRLIIVAMLASMASICCCLGVFAAFRVNHEPFTRSQSSNPPLQLVFGSGAPVVATDAAVAPFGVRFALNVPPAAGPIPTPTPTSHAAMEILAPNAVGTDAGQAAKEETQQDQDSAKDAMREVAVEAPAEPPPPAAVAMNTGTAPDSAASADAKTDTTANNSTDAKSDTPSDAKTDVKAEANPGAKLNTKPTVNTVPKIAAKPARKVVGRRIARPRRFRRPQTATAVQSPDLNFTLAPTYQALPQADTQTAPQAVRRRVVTKRHRPAKAAAIEPTATRQANAGRSTGTISR
jgi:hypothetical protein